MPNTNTLLQDAEIRHSVYVLGYSTQTYNRQSHFLDEMVSDLTRQLNARPPSDNSFTAKRLRKMLKAATEASNDAFKAVQAGVDGDMRLLAEYEASFHVKAIQEAFPIELALTAIPPAKIHAATMSKPFQGKQLRDWWKDQDASTQRQFKQALRLGFVEGETLGQMTTRLKGVGDMTKRQTQTIIRTANAHMSQVALDSTIDKNSAAFSEYDEWVATLDGRTSKICMRLSTIRYFKRGTGPQVPAHMNERSRRIAKTKTWKEMGFDDMGLEDQLDERPFVADKRRLKDIPKSERDQLTGTTTKKTYDAWLKTQNKSFVVDVLGPTKAKLYLEGNVSLDRFVSPQGVSYNIEQLAKREAKAFERVGL